MGESDTFQNRSEKEIFLAALDRRTPEERAAFLDGACGTSSALRARLDALLANHFQSDAFMETPVVEAERPTVKISFPEEAPGAVIGRYKLLQKIGEGGCGAVYMAEQEEPVRRRVALKVIKLGMDTKEVIARFEAERQALALMDHPNIAKVLDGGATANGRPYFVMDLVRGSRITDYCDTNNLATGERLKLFVQVCQAVQHAHQKGIIHRDLKPSNILVTVNDGVPVPKVIDFGIAKATAGRLTDKTLFTAFEQFLGTPAYMSPEQAEMSSLDIDTRSDIYSLGVLLYELLTGKTPFEAKDLLAAGFEALRRTIREKEPPRPSTRLSTMQEGELTSTARRRQTDALRLIHLVRGDLDWIVMKCLEKDRTRRYETANGLAMDLQRHLQNEPVIACPPSKFYAFQKLARRHKLAFAAGGAVVASLFLGFAISSFLFVREKEARASEAKMRQKALVAQQQAQAEADRAKAASAEASASEQRAKEKEIEAKKTLSASEFLQGCRLGSEKKPASALSYLARSFTDNASNAPASTSMAVLLASHSWMAPTLLLKPANSARFSPNGSLILTVSDDGSAQVWDAQSGRSLRTIAFSDRPASVLVQPFYSAQFSPDGTRILTAAWDKARVWDAQTGKPLSGTLQHGHEGAIIKWAQFSPDGNRVLTASGSYVLVWNAQSGQQVRELMDESLPITSAQLSPDGRRIVATAYDKARVWDVETGRLLARLQPRSFYPVISAQFSPDGTQVVTASEDGNSQVWDLQTGKPLNTPWQHFSPLLSAQFSPDGKQIITTTVGGAISISDAQTGKPMPGLPVQDERPGVVQFSPDGGRILTAAGSIVRVWDAQTREPLTEPLQHNAIVRSAQFSPDGKRLLTVAQDDTAQVWDLQNARPSLALLLKHGTGVNEAFFSPDDSLLLTKSFSTFRVWDAQTGQPLTKLLQASSAINSAQFSSDGRRIVTASPTDGTAQVWDARSGNLLLKTQGHGSGLMYAEFSPDGKRIVTAAFDGTAWLLDAQTGQSLLAMPLKQGSLLTSARFNADGTRIVTASQDGAAMVWDAQSGQPLCKLHHADYVAISSAEFSADSRHVLTVTKDGSAAVWDSRSGKPLTQLSGEVTDAQFSPDGKSILTISAKTVRVWDTLSGQPVTDPMQHRGTVASAQFSSDGKRIVTTEPGVAQLWDAQTGQKLLEEFHHGRNTRPGELKSSEGDPVVRVFWGVNSAQFSRDGKRVATTCDDGYVRVWDLAPSGGKAPAWLPQLAEAISGQTLNPSGLLVPTRLNRAEVIARLRQQVESDAANDDWSTWARWFLVAPATRSISPFSKQTIVQYVESRIAEQTEDSLSEAERVAGDDDALVKRIAEARATLKRAETIAALPARANSARSNGQPMEAISLLEQFCNANPADTDASLTLAVWQTWFGREADYEATRRRLVHQAEGTSEAGTAERAAKAYCIRPSSDPAMLATALTLAQSAVELGKNSSLLPYYRLELGLAQYRNGQYAAARESLAIAEQTVGNNNQDIQGTARFFRAMSLFRQGRSDEARSLFAQEEARMRPLPKDESKPLADEGPVSHDVLIWWLAYKEAKSTLNEATAMKP